VIFFAESAPVIVAKFNHPRAAADAHAHMHFDVLRIERIQVVMEFYVYKERQL
jgi:hypothetical protein